MKMIANSWLGKDKVVIIISNVLIIMVVYLRLFDIAMEHHNVLL